MSASQSRGVIPINGTRFIEALRQEYGRAESDVNAALGTTIFSWSSFDFRPQNFYIRGQIPREDGLARAYRAWQVQQPPESRFYFNITGQYRLYLRNQFGSDIAAYNAARGTTYTSFGEIPLASNERDASPLSAEQRQDREIFVREILNPLWIRLAPEAGVDWQAFLRVRHGTIQTLNQLAGTSFSSFEKVPFSTELPDRGQLMIDWNAFLQGWQAPESGETFRVSMNSISLMDAQFLFRKFLDNRFQKPENFARHAGYPVRSFSEIAAPFGAADFETFQTEKDAIKWEFTVRNYRSVWGFLAVNGRGIWNTVIFCTLAVGAALIFNPLAAYALSRFKPPLTYKLLLFLMLTMAFPPMVTQIPVFLMLRQFDLLNTFAALILPGLANGYSIFLLKGFFDSLPRELYESSEIDGASEWVIFSQITMSLSKPILAVIALGAFTGAYSAFMFALLLCQDQKMWTIMVWLYQLQQRSGEGIVFASLLIAAVPTLLVFLFAQKIIMRGIAVPVEK